MLPIFLGIVTASATNGMGRNERRVLQLGLSTVLLCNESVIRMV